jgi:hypothetical protein
MRFPGSRGTVPLKLFRLSKNWRQLSYIRDNGRFSSPLGEGIYIRPFNIPIFNPARSKGQCQVICEFADILVFATSDTFNSFNEKGRQKRH